MRSRLLIPDAPPLWNLAETATREDDLAGVVDSKTTEVREVGPDGKETVVETKPAATSPAPAAGATVAAPDAAKDKKEVAQ